MLECLISQRATAMYLFWLWNGLLEEISSNPTMSAGDGISNYSSHSVTNLSTVVLSNISSTPTIIKCIGLVFVVLVCIFGNSVMVIGIRKSSHMRSNSNVLVASLTIADIIMGMGALVQVVVQPYVYVFSRDPCSYKKLIAILFILVRYSTARCERTSGIHHRRSVRCNSLSIVLLHAGNHNDSLLLHYKLLDLRLYRCNPFVTIFTLRRLVLVRPALLFAHGRHCWRRKLRHNICNHGNDVREDIVDSPGA